MDENRWKQARALFEALANAVPADWPALLEAACPDDPVVRADALGLLQADHAASQQASRIVGQAPELLDAIAVHAENRLSKAWIGQHLGAWRIVRTLGRGGMGMVYLAERDDGEFRQQAALKLLRGGGDNDAALQRFMVERQILAQLEHPHIARLLDGGSTAESGPWFALEYVEGVTLTAWCDSHQLDVRNRLRLFLDVCAAVSYAHEHLIVHRDLKPANIMIDGQGRVKLLDFGIAKLLDDAATAQTGTVLRTFTPEYAAPEQVRGDAMTTAVDVYALGVILYELLTGRRPYRIADRSPAAYERAIVEQNATRPSGVVTQAADHDNEPGVDDLTLARRRGLNPPALRARLRGDLDAIVLKALRKEPEQRYGSVRELADDLRAVLDHRPVAARRGGTRYLAGRFLRRNGLVVGMAASAFIALAIGLAVALSQAREARIQRDSAQQSLAFMTDLFQNADPGMRDRADLTVRDLLDEGVRNIRYGMPKPDRARAELLLAMASGYLGLFLPEPAEPLIAEVIDIARVTGDVVMLAEASLE